ncbi:MAG TPA: hypothetical protein VFE96_00755 [Candidatus Bathyarchaeia archaeon]|jgi:plastocyanin|nr:hypothetical protein [Candidatus Bathyarchaeia archaeon]
MKKRQRLVIATVVLLSLSLGLLTVDRFPRIPVAHAIVVDKISLTGCVQVVLSCRVVGWNGTTTAANPTITVHQGDNVTLSLSTQDMSAHQFLFDADKDGASDTADCPTTDPCSAIIPTGGSTVTYWFIENAPPAIDYKYFCVFHPAQMAGTFVVMAATVGATVVPQKTPSLRVPPIALVSILLSLIALAVLHARRSEKETTSQ